MSKTKFRTKSKIEFAIYDVSLYLVPLASPIQLREDDVIGTNLHSVRLVRVTYVCVRYFFFFPNVLSFINLSTILFSFTS